MSFISAFLVLFAYINRKHGIKGKKTKASHRGSGLLTNSLLEEGANGDDDGCSNNTYEETKTDSFRSFGDRPAGEADRPCRIWKLDVTNKYDDERYQRCTECGHARDVHRFSSEYSEDEERYVISEVL